MTTNIEQLAIIAKWLQQVNFVDQLPKCVIALAAYEQLDEEGVFVKVSREAVDKSIAAFNDLMLDKEAARLVAVQSHELVVILVEGISTMQDIIENLDGDLPTNLVEKLEELGNKVEKITNAN